MGDEQKSKRAIEVEDCENNPTLKRLKRVVVGQRVTSPALSISSSSLSDESIGNLSQESQILLGHVRQLVDQLRADIVAQYSERGLRNRQGNMLLSHAVVSIGIYVTFFFLR